MRAGANDAGARAPARNWDAVAAIVAALIGLMALLVSGYTAFVQRQQVSAQVWPYLLIGYADNDRSRIVFNKGVGPALVRSVQIFVDGKPLQDWEHVMAALGIKVTYAQSTLAHNVLSPGERLQILQIADENEYRPFREQSFQRASMRLCYCSTLGDCWMYDDQRPSDDARSQAVDHCPDLSREDSFRQ